MNTFSAIYLKYRYPRYKKAFSLAFNPDSYHHYPNELRSNVKNLNHDILTEGLVKTLTPYAQGGIAADNLIAIRSIANCIITLPSTLESIIELVNHSKLTFANKMNLLAVIIYLISPVDIIPEEDTSGISYADDIIVTSVAFNEITPVPQRHILKENWQGSADNLEELLSIAPFAKDGLPHLYNMAYKAFHSIYN